MNNYEIEKVIGEGSFGKALLCRRRSDRKRCIIKQISLGHLSPKEAKQTQQEATLLERLNHPNIVSFWDAFVKSSNLFIVMEFADGGDLDQFIKRRRGRFMSEVEVLQLFVQISLAIKHTHDRKILHRDLKPGNIFLTTSGLVKLGDFGVSRVLKNTGEFACTQIGTPYYMSPEIMDSKRYNSKTDIWSLGCILYEIMCLKLPFEGNSMTQLCQNIQTGNGAFVCKTLAYSTALKDLCRDMLQKNSVLRPGINAILARPVVKSRISSFLDASKKRREFSHTVLHGMQILTNLPDREQHVEQEKMGVNEMKEMDHKKGPADKAGIQVEKDRIARNQETERLRQMIWKAEGQDSPAPRLGQQKANKSPNVVPQNRQVIQDQKVEMQLEEVVQEHQKRGNEDGRKKIEGFRSPEKMRSEVPHKDNAVKIVLAARQAQERIHALNKEEPRSQKRVESIMVSRVEVNPEERNRELIRRDMASIEKKGKSPDKNVEPSFQCRADQVSTPPKLSQQDALLNKCPQNRAVDRPPSVSSPAVEPPVESKGGVAVASGDMKAKVRDNLLRFEKERLERQAKAERKINERARRIRERQDDLQSLSPSSKQPPSPAPQLRPQHQKVSDRVEIDRAVKLAPADEILAIPMLPPPPPPKMTVPESSLSTAIPIDQRSEEIQAQASRPKNISAQAAAILTEQTSTVRSSNDTFSRADPEGSQKNDHRGPAIREKEGNINAADFANHIPHQEDGEKYGPMGQKNVSPFIFSENTFDRRASEEDEEASGAVRSSGLDVEFSIEVEEEFAELFAQMQEVVGQSFSENQSDGYSHLDSALEEDDDTFEEDNYEYGEDEIRGD